MMSLPIWLLGPMFLPWGLCPGVSVRGSLFKGLSVKGAFCERESLSKGVSVKGSLCQRESLSKGVSVKGVSVKGLGMETPRY